MAQRTWQLTDVSKGISREHFVVGPGPDLKLDGADNWRVSKRTLRGGLSEGVEILDLDNGALSLSILPTRGMGIWRGQYRGIELGWKSPVRQPVHPGFVNAVARNGLGWLSGFNELMCRCGLSSNGAPGLDVVEDGKGGRSETPLTLHGKIANIPAHTVEVAVHTEGKGTIAVSGAVDECELFGPCLRLETTLTTEAGGNVFRIVDKVTNLGGKPADLEMLYHTNLGRPFLEEGAQFVAPLREVSPRDRHAASDIGHWQTYLGPTPNYVEQCYFVEPVAQGEQALVMLRNAAGEKGFSMRYNTKQLPCFTLWKNTQAEADGYCTGLEPGTNLPNLKTYERKQGRVIVLQPGQSHTMTIEFAVHASAADVKGIEDQITGMQKPITPVVHSSPVAKHSPVE
jgi:galactose mutarotase-like enzyme